MQNKIIRFGWDHTNSTVTFRDRIMVSRESLSYVLKTLTEKLPEIREAGALATCNRMEYYLIADSADIGSIMDFIYGKLLNTELSPEDPDPLVLRGNEAVGHLFRVASGLKSLMIGEAQILSQVKSAYDLLLENGDRSPILNRLFQEAIRTGKQVREDTAVGRGAVSVSMAAVEMSKHVFSEFHDKKAVLLGAGETSELAARHFLSLGLRNFTIVNRGEERGKALAELTDGVYRPLADIEDALTDADIVVAATSSKEPLISLEMVQRALKKGRKRLLYLADISSPRNIDPDVAGLPSVFLADMDNLDHIVRENMKKREAAVEDGLQICEQNQKDFEDWLNSLNVVPTISGLANYFDGLRKQILAEYEFKTNDKEYARMDELSRKIVKRLLHNPIRYLRDMAGEEKLDYTQIDTIWQIFNLEQMLVKYHAEKVGKN